MQDEANAISTNPIVVITLITSTASLLTAAVVSFFTYLQNRRAAEASERISRGVEENTAMTQRVVDKAEASLVVLEEVHIATNSGLTKVQDELKVANENVMRQGQHIERQGQQIENLTSLLKGLIDRKPDPVADAHTVSIAERVTAKELDNEIRKTNELIVPTIIEGATQKVEDAAQKVDDAAQKVDDAAQKIGELGSLADTVGDTHERVKKIEKEIVREKGEKTK